MYLCARFLSPDPLRESETTSIEDYYFRIKTPFLSIFMYGMITWPIGEYLGLYSAETTALSLADLLGLAAIFVLLLAAILSSNRNVHGVVVIAILVLQVAGEVAQGSLHQ